MKKSVMIALTAIAAILVACGPKEDPIVEVTSVSLSQTTLSIARGGTTTLTATVGPHNATDKTVVWSSSNSSVVTVEKGTVSAVAVGTATITATASGKTATCEVTVTPKGITSIRLEQGAAELNINEVFTLVSSVEPADADETLTWSSSDENVAKVENGKITAVGKGKATITASAGTLKVSCYVTVICPINSISLNKSTAQIEEYETLTLTATVDTEDPDIKVEWSSDYTSIATVDDNGEVYGLKVGITTITAKAGDKSASCKVTVKEAAHKAKERAALIKLFNANNGNNWDDHTKQNWCSDKPMELWTGVEMTPDGAHVRSLWLNDSNLKGQILKR